MHQDSKECIPWINILLLTSSLKMHQIGISLYKYPTGYIVKKSNSVCITNDPKKTITQALTDGDAKTKWGNFWYPIPTSPMTYDIVLGQKIAFWDVKIVVS